MNCDTYEWSWIDDTVGTRVITVTPDVSGWYYIEVNTAGCLGRDSVYVVVGVLPYDAITPNNDGYNDTWTPLDIWSYPNAVVQIFNRWGSLVYETSGGLGYIAWDGTRNGKDLPVGTYYYIIDLNTDDEPQTGPITIIR
jgi:gliding motility-associated-like protein